MNRVALPLLLICFAACSKSNDGIGIPRDTIITRVESKGPVFDWHDSTGKDNEPMRLGNLKAMPGVKFGVFGDPSNPRRAAVSGTITQDMDTNVLAVFDYFIDEFAKSIDTAGSKWYHNSVDTHDLTTSFTDSTRINNRRWEFTMNKDGQSSWIMLAVGENMTTNAK